MVRNQGDLEALLQLSSKVLPCHLQLAIICDFSLKVGATCLCLGNRYKLKIDTELMPLHQYTPALNDRR